MNYYNELPTTGADEEVMMILGIMLAIMGVVLVFGLVCWIFSSLSLQKIAKRRGIRNAWLAWLPFGNHWILGSVSDQYEHLVQGKITSRRKILLGLDLAGLVASTAYFVLSIGIGLAAEFEGVADVAPMWIMIPYFLFLGVSIASMVFYHICNYDLYRSCNPQNAVVFLVLGIIISVCQPFFYFACRKKDLGMAAPGAAAPAAPAAPAELPKANPEF